MANARCGGIGGGREARLADPWHLEKLYNCFLFRNCFSNPIFLTVWTNQRIMSRRRMYSNDFETKTGTIPAIKAAAALVPVTDNCCKNGNRIDIYVLCMWMHFISHSPCSIYMIAYIIFCVISVLFLTFWLACLIVRSLARSFHFERL